MAFSHDSTMITIIGAENGDALRSYMLANSLESVNDRDITLSTRRLLINSGATLTDNNAMYVVSGANADITNNGTINFSNVIYRVSGDTTSIRALGLGVGAVNNFSDSFYVINADEGNRVDFFSNTGRLDNFSNTSLVHTGFGFMHLYGTSGSKNAYNGVTAVVSGGIVIEHADFTDCVFDFPAGALFNDKADSGVPNVYTRLSWNRTTWNFGRNGAAGGAKFIDPIKPPGWTAYTGASLDKVEEVFTHNLLLQDDAGNPIQGAEIRLTNNTTSVAEYDVSTAADGTITEQEVVTFPFSQNVYYDDFSLGVWSYGKQIKSESRPFSTTGSPIDETVILLTDGLVTEQNQATVQAYTESENSKKAYDLSHNHAIENKLNEVPATLVGNTYNARTYNLVIDANAIQTFAFDGSTITIKASTFKGDITTTGTVTLINGASIIGGIADANGDSNLTVTVPTGYENDVDVYTSQSNAENQANQVAGGSSFRYQSALFGGQTMWFRMTQSDGSFIIENYLFPAEAGNYSISLVVTSENAALGSIKAVTDKLDSMLEVVGGNNAFRQDALGEITGNVKLARDHARGANINAQNS